MVIQLPCEITLWYVVPAIRKETVSYLAAKGVKRKEIANALDLTESAVSQYLKGKRGNNYTLAPETKKQVHLMADELISKPEMNAEIFIEKTCDICTHVRQTDTTDLYQISKKCPVGKN